MPFLRFPTEFTILKVQVVPVSKTTGCVLVVFGASLSIDIAPYMHLYTDLLTGVPSFEAVIVTLDVFNCPDKASYERNTY